MNTLGSRFLLALALTLALGAALGGCAQRDHAAPSAAAALGQMAQPTAAGEAARPSAERAMRITVETSIEVSDIPSSSAAVRAAVGRSGGYLGEARTAGSDGARSASFEAHIPVGHLPAFRAEIAKLGDTVSDAEKAEDVTEQRADINARLGNARAAEKRLLELLQKQTGNLAEVVAVEKELGSVRETIERMEAQQRVLEGQIASATVKIHLVTRYSEKRLGAGSRITRAAGDGIQNAGQFMVGLVVMLAAFGPTLLLLAAMGYAVFRVVRHLARRGKPPVGGP